MRAANYAGFGEYLTSKAERVAERWDKAVQLFLDLLFYIGWLRKRLWMDGSLLEAGTDLLVVSPIVAELRQMHPAAAIDEFAEMIVEGSTLTRANLYTAAGT